MKGSGMSGMRNPTEGRAARLIASADSLLITAGAGMGVDSGRPDFRGESQRQMSYLNKTLSYTKIGLVIDRRLVMLQTLRKAGGSLVMTVPKAFIDQNGLGEGSQVELHLLGKKMTVEAPTRPRYKLADLMAEMPQGLPRVEGWDEMPSVGLENG